MRATEIETFDRASLIVPNSELITGRVLNWTHRDSLGAVSVKVGVAYDADPEQVIAILRSAPTSTRMCCACQSQARYLKISATAR